VREHGLEKRTLRSYYLNDEGEGPLFDYGAAGIIVEELFQDCVSTGALTLPRDVEKNEYDFHVWGSGSSTAILVVNAVSGKKETVITGVYRWFESNPLMISWESECLLRNLGETLGVLSAS
jgi:hypothetical protein